MLFLLNFLRWLRIFLDFFDSSLDLLAGFVLITYQLLSD